MRCLRCGDCCRRSSPTLLPPDLERVRDGHLRWDRLCTLRAGEAGHSPFSDAAFYLPDERIKVCEHPGGSTCVFWDDETNACGIYAHRPEQCRLQQCWDPAPALEQARGPFLSRREVFAGADPLLALIAEHDRRCSFDAMRAAFERVQQGDHEAADEVVGMLAFDDHVRGFVSGRFEMLAHALDLLFGRPLGHLVRLFGFEVVNGPDGTRVLRPEARPAAGGERGQGS